MRKAKLWSFISRHDIFSYLCFTFGLGWFFYIAGSLIVYDHPERFFWLYLFQSIGAAMTLAGGIVVRYARGGKKEVKDGWEQYKRWKKPFDDIEKRSFIDFVLPQNNLQILLAQHSRKRGMRMNTIIEVENVSKYYRDVKAVDGISFHVQEGQLFAFLGPNGAGKSTTIDIICTLLKPDSGTVKVNGLVLGEKDYAIKNTIGVVFQKGLLDDLLTVKENLQIRSSFYGLSPETARHNTEEAIQATSIADFLDRPYGKLSGGQKRRADIARALINRPKILFLDEPTTGLDPQTRKNVWDMIRHLQQQTGMTVFLTTHYMEEAAGADYVVVIDEGKIAAEGTPESLKERYSFDKLILYATDPLPLTTYLAGQNLCYSANGNTITVSLQKTLNALPILNDCALYLKHFEVLMGSMDDAFIGITGKEMRP